MGTQQPYETLDQYLSHHPHLQRHLIPLVELRDQLYQGSTTTLYLRLQKSPSCNPRIMKTLERDLGLAAILFEFEHCPHPQRAVIKGDEVVAEDIVRPPHPPVSAAYATTNTTRTTDATTTSDDGAPNAPVPSPITPRP